MKKKDVIVKRQKYNNRFKNEDMDFMFNWAIGISQIIGLAPSQVFNAVRNIKDGDPNGWRMGFTKQGDFLIQNARKLKIEEKISAGQSYLGGAYAFRSALQYTDSTSDEFNELVAKMETSFQQGIELLGVPMVPIEIPFENTSLPGYFLKHDNNSRPVVMMVGGGDTFREDLFYFAGYPGWKRGYNVIMVDLPGQGKLPSRGQYFKVDSDKPISTILDWLEKNSVTMPDNIAIYGVSGGGYFSAQGAAADHRINAWIASTPIFDMKRIFEGSFGKAAKIPGWLLNTIMHLAGLVNESSEINLKKYAWQFGTSNFKQVVEGVLIQAKSVDLSLINCPALFLMSEGEDEDLRTQTKEAVDNFKQRGISVTLREFSADEGADGHCQINNLKLAHLVVFDWLDHLFNHDSGDVRLYS